ncbi:MAG: aldehyde ferredoxin oxidoreductase family protein [Dehalococcoidia bacterium]
MNPSKGFAGANLHVDLTSGKVKRVPIDSGFVRSYIGGLGIASRLLSDMVPPGTDPLSPENVLIFASGPLTGTLAPGAARVYAMAKSPLSGLLGTSNGGHSAGIMLKYAGYDNLVITGRAERPVYIKVSDEDVEIVDAGHIWGKDTWQTVDILVEEIGRYAISCIGPAGENLVRFANIMSNKRSGFNKTGLGAVMGSKNLKAIAVRGTKGVEVEDRRGFRKLVDALLAGFAASPETTSWRQYGSAARWKADKEGFGREEFRQRVWKRYYACLACPVACKHDVHLRGGSYDGLAFHISGLPSLSGHHQMAGMENWDELSKCVELENRYGLDGAAMAGVVNLVAQLREQEIISEKDTEGLDLTWGAGTLRQLIPLIAHREGIGDLLAEGARGAAKIIGGGAEQYANHVKGVQKEPDIGSTFPTGEFGRATNPRGGHGDRAGSIANLPDLSPQSLRDYCLEIGMPEDALDRVCRGPHGYNVARLTKWTEDFNTVLLSLGVCNRDPMKSQLNLETLADLYTAATGIETAPAEMVKAGERIWNLQKVFNVRHGWTRTDDTPNTRSPDEPIVVGGKTYGTFNQLLDEYYQERGWDVATGVPLEEKLNEVGLGGALSQ